ncbi:hypothetical protein D3C72_114440 [compost metagenome]
MHTLLPSSAATTRRLCFAALLVVLVLFAQWMGLRHRIEHANWSGLQHSSQQLAQDSAASQEYEGDKSHSCILFDGMALADGAPLLPFTAILQTGVQVLALWAAYTSWDAPLLCHFSSRAPPRA